MGCNRKGRSTAVLFLTFSSILTAAPRLGLSTNAVGTVNIATGAAGPAQTVQAFNLGDGSLNLTATSSASWLAATVGAKTSCAQPGGSCYPINIALNTASLAAGTYTEYVTLTDPNAVDSPQDIAVTVNTTGVPASINAWVTRSTGSTPTAIFPVFTTGTGVKGTVNTQSGGNWLQFLNGASGLIPSPAPWLLQVAAQLGQAPGTYQGSIVISGSSVASENRTINVTLNVTDAPIAQLNNNSTIRLTSYQGGPPQYSFVTFNNLTSGTTLSVTGATGSASFLTASVSSGSTILITADPKGLTPGVYTGAVTISSNAANNSQISVPVELVVGPAGQPMISMGGIVNAANGAREPVSQGDIASIYGGQLAPAGTTATNASTPLATTLGGVQVLVNGVPAPLYYVSPGQINFQVPYGLTAGAVATVQVVSNGTAGNIRSLSVNATSPRLLYFVSFIQGTYGVIVNGSDGSLTLPSGTGVPGFNTHPAKPGDTIVIYGVGFGQTTPAAVEGVAASASPLLSIPNATATFGGGFNGAATSATPVFTGLTPTAVGLYQANVTIPSDTPLGASVPVTILVNGVQSNTVHLAITASGQ
ncbi:MAG TPA: hypothetical protein VHB50_16055 [Bryobacteraceae bacterium]|nr:hypothetical protein [Bryobacteraceae bacterium]